MAGIADIKREAGGAAAGVSEELIVKIFDAITSLARKGEKVMIKDVGTFSQEFREAREGVNPQDPKGAKIQIEAKHVLKFKQSKQLDMSPPKPARAAARGRRG